MARGVVTVVVCGLVSACGPGRQAAWEKQAEAAPAAAPADGATSTTEASPDGEQAWLQRGERSQLEKAVTLWEQQQAGKTDDAALLTQLSRAYYFLADGHLRSAGADELMLTTFEKGIAAGERAMMASSSEFATRVKNGEKVEDAIGAIPASGQAALYWYASNLGKFAVAKGFTTVLFYKDRIFAVMQRVLTLDETFFHGAPHRYFGAYYAKAPSFAGGDMEKAKVHFDKALEIAPHYLGTKVLYAEFYATKTEDRALFTRLLGEVKAADPHALPDLLPEQQMEQAKADRLLGQADEIF